MYRKLAEELLSFYVITSTTFSIALVFTDGTSEDPFLKFDLVHKQGLDGSFHFLGIIMGKLMPLFFLNYCGNSSYGLIYAASISFLLRRRSLIFSAS